MSFHENDRSTRIEEFRIGLRRVGRDLHLALREQISIIWWSVWDQADLSDRASLCHYHVPGIRKIARVTDGFLLGYKHEVAQRESSAVRELSASYNWHAVGHVILAPERTPEGTSGDAPRASECQIRYRRPSPVVGSGTYDAPSSDTAAISSRAT